MSNYKYKTLNANGEECCAGSRPDFERCPNCRQLAPVDHRFANAKPNGAYPRNTDLSPDVEALGVPGLVQRIVYDAVSQRDGDDVAAFTPPDPYADALAQMKENRR